MPAPRRRGRPARASVPLPSRADGANVIAPEETSAPTRRRRRADDSGLHLRLAVPERTGWIRRWVNDEPGRLAQVQELAYTHVEDDSIKSDGADSRVRRYVGTGRHGQPLHAYLMETPEREYAYGQQEKAEATRAIEEAIKEGRGENGRIDNQYGKVSITG